MLLVTPQNVRGILCRRQAGRREKLTVEGRFEFNIIPFLLGYRN